MNYEEFAKEYTSLFKKMMSYSPTQVGAGIYADKMADLADQYPEFAEKVEQCN